MKISNLGFLHRVEYWNNSFQNYFSIYLNSFAISMLYTGIRYRPKCGIHDLSAMNDDDLEG